MCWTFPIGIPELGSIPTNPLCWDTPLPTEEILNLPVEPTVALPVPVEDKDPLPRDEVRWSWEEDPRPPLPNLCKLLVPPVPVVEITFVFPTVALDFSPPVVTAQAATTNNIYELLQYISKLFFVLKLMYIPLKSKIIISNLYNLYKIKG